MDIENKIRDKIIENIDSGKYKTDDKLPSDNELAEKYSVSRIIIRNTYKKLEEMGYVYSLQGRGRFVNKKHIDIEISLLGNESFSKKLSDKGYKVITVNIGSSRIKYNEKIFKKLNITEEYEVYKISRLRVVDDIPLAIHTSYVSNKLFPNIKIESLNITSIFEYYRGFGIVNFTSSESVLNITYPTAIERKYLECKELVPLLKVESNSIDCDSNNVLEYTEIVYRGDIFSYKIT